MLQLGSKLKMLDNSGARAVRIFHLGKKKTMKNTYLSYNTYIKGSVISFVAHKKIKKKEKVYVLIISAKKKKSRKNGCYISFFENYGIVFNDLKKRKPIATKTKLTVPKEVKKSKKNKLIYKIVTKSI